jgi:hypothetical protein
MTARTRQIIFTPPAASGPIAGVVGTAGGAGHLHDLRRGDVAVLCVLHDPACPGAHGRPDACCCVPDIRLEVLHREARP